MIFWISILGVAYILLLVFLSLYSRKQNKSFIDFMLGGGKVGLTVGFMSFLATLFSTFTLMGMPDFFRMNGIGAWIFLAFSDAVMVFFLIYFSIYLRKNVSNKGFLGISGTIRGNYGSQLAAWVYFTGIFIFLVPYVAIQIRGISIFLEQAIPAFLPYWGWSVLLVALILLYSETGGLKAIMFADVVQGVILLVIVLVIGAGCVNALGGMENMFAEVEKVKPELLSVPGPNGLFSVQFLISTVIVISMIPVTQPQLTTRIVIMKDIRATHLMAISVGFFALIIILPTIAIGMYGAVKYPDHTTAEFLHAVLLQDQPPFLAAATIIGLLAAALSTSDSQIFALGSEFRSLWRENNTEVPIWKMRVAVLFFALAGLIFSLISGDELVMLGRLSFAGTSILGPMILVGIFSKNKPGMENVYATILAMVIFLSAQMGLFPKNWFGLQAEMVLLILLGILGLASVLIRKGHVKSN